MEFSLVKLKNKKFQNICIAESVEFGGENGG
jgi:hypothetical protein